MTLPEWLSAWRHGVTPLAEHEGPVPQTSRPKPRVPNEYLSLYRYLDNRYASMVVLTFEQIESLLGFALPESARTCARWWADEVATDRHSETWTAARRKATPNLLARTVAFERLP